MENECQLFDFESYKNELINHYNWEKDKNRQVESQTYIDSHYTDEFFQMVIDKTHCFLLNLLEEMNSQRNLYKNSIFLNKEYPEMRKMLISNGCGGGCPCDKIFFVDNKTDIMISERLITRFFGKIFRIEFGTNFYESYNEEDETGYEYGVNRLGICGPVEEFDVIFSKYVSDQHIKTKLKK